jgi:predicted DCC family thiol-disulfide oxidoreductase YuxK
MIESENHSLILFDGICNLCNSSVRFVIKHDPKGEFRFAPLQSDFSIDYLKNMDPAISNPDSIILIQDGQIYTASTAVLKIMKRLSGLWPALHFFIIIPKNIRDYFYSLIAKHRYKMFGKREQCMIPGPGDELRFISNAIE